MILFVNSSVVSDKDFNNPMLIHESVWIQSFEKFFVVHNHLSYFIFMWFPIRPNCDKFIMVSERRLQLPRIATGAKTIFSMTN